MMPRVKVERRLERLSAPPRVGVAAVAAAGSAPPIACTHRHFSHSALALSCCCDASVVPGRCATEDLCDERVQRDADLMRPVLLDVVNPGDRDLALVGPGPAELPRARSE